MSDMHLKNEFNTKTKQTYLVQPFQTTLTLSNKVFHDFMQK